MIVPGVPFSPSPNCSSREGTRVDAVVLHHISLPPGSFGGPYVLDFFQNRLDPAAHPYFRELATLRVSCHFYLDRRGRVVQLVDTDEKAWHAGVSELDGAPDVNRFSVGIELEGDEVTSFTEAQYAALEPLLRALRAALPAITTERIVGHEHIAPGRKRDPGPLFDWERLRRWFAETLA
ncbi:MAG: 1,6-anhydro-N-acetylmuramyl-L-alanine amidase AmpD [Deltaproteobacteria bacterium]|nr:1,6-anhydro-N-acetylmuramyl-L-alanine amidase AmpD [Deltaproteobacteria bacterium]